MLATLAGPPSPPGPLPPVPSVPVPSPPGPLPPPARMRTEPFPFGTPRASLRQIGFHGRPRARRALQFPRGPMPVPRPPGTPPTIPPGRFSAVPAPGRPICAAPITLRRHHHRHRRRDHRWASDRCRSLKPPGCRRRESCAPHRSRGYRRWDRGGRSHRRQSRPGPPFPVPPGSMIGEATSPPATVCDSRLTAGAADCSRQLPADDAGADGRLIARLDSSGAAAGARANADADAGRVRADVPCCQFPPSPLPAADRSGGLRTLRAGDRRDFE